MKRLAFLLIAATFAQAVAQTKPPKFTARLHAARHAVAPGGQIEIAIEVEIEEPWHIYHPALHSGIPTTFSFDTPPGVSVGDVRFPTPVLGKLADVEYLGHTGRIVFLAPLTLAAGLEPGAPLELKVLVKGLACKETCLPVEASASLKLPVAGTMGKPANEKLFADARRQMPPRFSDAPYIKGSRLAVSYQRVPIGGSAEIAAVIKVIAGHHIQDRDPGVKDLIPSRLFIEHVDGITFDEKKQLWPKPHVRDVEYIGKVREQSGEVVVRAPFQVTDQKIKPGPVTLHVLFQYQCCTDAGQCYPPIMAEGFVNFEIVPAGTAVTKNQDPVFKTTAAATADVQADSGPDGSGRGSRSELLWIFLGAFLGGVILNVTPCVLPVLSIKVFGFMQQAGEEPGRVYRLGLVYGLGILASFAVLAAVMVALKKPWGGFMQEANYIVVLSAVVLAFALSLFGVFEIQLPGATLQAAEAAATREGYPGAFLKGVLATALATPCTAPFLGSALGLLLALPSAVMAAGIMMVGVGLAAPYVLLTAFPGWLRFLPKPGPWMVTFKQIMGFVLLATVVWLLSVLKSLGEPGVLLGTLAFLVAVGLGCWLLGRIGLNATVTRTLTHWGGIVAVLMVGWFGSFSLFAADENPIPWQDWEPGLPVELAEEGYTVYVDYTATWCLTCQANKKIVLESEPVRRKLQELDVVPIKADFTRYDPRIQKELNEHDRNGVPLNIILPAGKPEQVIVLPEILTKSRVLEALERAGPSQKTPELVRKAP